MRTVLSTSLALGLLTALAGCGGGSAGVTLAGTVTLRDGKPLPGGRVEFVSPSGNTLSAPISADGKYEAPGLAPGEYKVAVVNAHLQGASGAKPPPGLNPMPGDTSGLKYVRIDAKFAKADTSGLTAVVGGDRTQTFDVPLK